MQASKKERKKERKKEESEHVYLHKERKRALAEIRICQWKRKFFTFFCFGVKTIKMKKCSSSNVSFDLKAER
jgi:hypothetical protein